MSATETRTTRAKRLAAKRAHAARDARQLAARGSRTPDPYHRASAKREGWSL